MSLAIACPVLTVGASPVPEVYTSVPASLSMLSGDEAALGMLKGIERSFGGVPIVALHDLCRAEVFLAETELGGVGEVYICSSAPRHHRRPDGPVPGSRQVPTLQREHIPAVRH